MKNMDSLPRGIKYVSLYEPSGYGTAARRYLRGLRKTSISLTWTPMVPGRGWGMGYEPFAGKEIGAPELDSICNQEVEYDTVLVHTVPEYYPFWKKKEPGKRIIGYTVWETDRIPDHWPSLLNGVDRLLVPCHWNKEAFRRCGVVTPIEVIHHILTDAEPSASAGFPDIRPTDYVFYSIGTCTVRKALWNTLRK
jgi:hypothetical protein